MTPEEFSNQMKVLAENHEHDAEERHFLADALLCEVLHSLGYEAGVVTFISMEKWYA